MRGPKPMPIEDDDTGTTQLRISTALIRGVDDFSARFPLEGGRNEVVRNAIRDYLRRRDPKWRQLLGPGETQPDKAPGGARPQARRKRADGGR